MVERAALLTAPKNNPGRRMAVLPG
jgi:hypothetical protein